MSDETTPETTTDEATPDAGETTPEEPTTNDQDQDAGETPSESIFASQMAEDDDGRGTTLVVSHADGSTDRVHAGTWMDRLQAREYRKVAHVRALRMDHPFAIHTREGWHEGKAGDYLVGPGAGGEFWLVDGDIFEASHREV